MDKAKVILIMGPTASGKTKLGIDVAKELDGEIISVDSALVFRGMDIGTAKPDMQERSGIKHHLIDIIDPVESFSAGLFREQTLALIKSINERGKTAVLVGGTMLYFSVLLKGIAVLPDANESVRKEIDDLATKKGWAFVHQQLQKVDPTAAQRIHQNDPQRIQRALEIYQVSGRSQTEWVREQESVDLPFVPIKFSIAPTERRDLHAKIEQRFDLMLEHGFEQEVQALFNRTDLHPALPAIRAVGYRQMWSYLANDYDHSTMREKAIIATRQLAKRQFTWLRRETDLIPLKTGDESVLGQVLQAFNKN